MSSFSELIKSFDKTRDYVRDFFIYGFKVRSDFSRKSKRTYDDERRRAESWLSEHIRYKDSTRGRQVSLSVDSGHITENPLYQAYYAKSFTDNDIRLHFFLLDLLSDGKSLTLAGITEGLQREYGAAFDVQTVRGKLREYCSEGLILAEKQGRSTVYRLSPDTVDHVLEEYPGLDDALRFFSEVQPFGVIGNSILKSAGLRNEVFLQKHHAIVRALEDEMLCTVLDAMGTHKSLQFQVYSSRAALSGDAEGREEACIPLQIFTSVQTGRRYLVGYVPAYGRFNAFRLDFLREVKPGSQCAEYDSYAETLRQNLPRLFGVSFGSRRADGTLSPLTVTLHIGKDEGFIRERIARELRCGTCAELDAQTVRLTLDVFDPKEALPWLRTFTGRILSIEGGSDAVQKQFQDDLTRMHALYKEV